MRRSAPWQQEPEQCHPRTVESFRLINRAVSVPCSVLLRAEIAAEFSADAPALCCACHTAPKFRPATSDPAKCPPPEFFPRHCCAWVALPQRHRNVTRSPHIGSGQFFPLTLPGVSDVRAHRHQSPPHDPTRLRPSCSCLADSKDQTASEAWCNNRLRDS